MSSGSGPGPSTSECVLLGEVQDRTWLQAPGTHLEGRHPLDFAGFASCLGGGGLQGGWWCHKWPKLCTREDSLMRSLPYLSPTLLLFHPLHWVSCSGLFSGARLGKEAFMRIVAKAYFFL